VVKRVPWDLKVMKDLWAQRVLWVRRDLWVSQVTTASRDLQGLRGLKAMRVHPDHLVFLPPKRLHRKPRSPRRNLKLRNRIWCDCYGFR
jgi:hypothetical protein